MGLGFNMTSVFFEGCNISFLKTVLTLAYKNVTQLKCINKTETETNDAPKKKCAFLYTISQVILAVRMHCSGRFSCGETAVNERLR